MSCNFYDEYEKMIQHKKMMDMRSNKYLENYYDNRNKKNMVAIANLYFAHYCKPLICMPRSYGNIKRAFRVHNNMINNFCDNIAESSKHIENYFDL